jgi:hypothetical protein
MKKVRVLYHDNCFDGVSSAAVFSRFYKAQMNAGAVIEYEGLTHKAGQHIADEQFGDDENVIVDFKYSASDKLTWWFDHHESAFLSAQDEAHFRGDKSNHKFHDPSYKSCTKFIAHITRTVFNCPMPDLDDLVYWADIIDGAQFPDAQTAVELKEPAIPNLSTESFVKFRTSRCRMLSTCQRYARRLTNCMRTILSPSKSCAV